MKPCVTVIGAGFAGSEAAWQLLRHGFPVRLYEMRPQKMTPAHHTGGFAELVCSNSLRADRLENGPGLLKEEMRRLGTCLNSELFISVRPRAILSAITECAVSFGPTLGTIFISFSNTSFSICS